MTGLTTEQCVGILESICLSITIVNVDLEGIKFSRGVPSELLADAVSRLQIVNLDKAGLTSEQYVKVVEAALSSKNLVSLSLKGAQISQWEDEHMSQLVEYWSSEPGVISSKIIFK